MHDQREVSATSPGRRAGVPTPALRHDTHPGRGRRAPGPALHERGDARARLPSRGATSQAGASRCPTPIILPLSKSSEWWSLSSARPSSVLLPAPGRPVTGTPCQGSRRWRPRTACARLFRRVYHNPDGYRAPRRVRLRDLCRVRGRARPDLQPHRRGVARRVVRTPSGGSSRRDPSGGAVAYSAGSRVSG